MMKLDRKSAKEIIAKNSVDLLTAEKIADILYEYWWYDNEEDIKNDIEQGQIPSLSEEVIKLIVQTETPPKSISPEILPLVIHYQIFSLKYVTNRYLEHKLFELNISCEVDGEIEEAGLCPCCHYFSIDPGEDGLWDICPVCFWENGGDGPNHISIVEAANNFKQFGAIKRELLEFVDPEGPRKYKN